MNTIAERYVKLVLNIGVYDSDYVDAYYGPKEWNPSGTAAIKREKFPFAEFDNEAESLSHSLKSIDTSRMNSIEKLRHASMAKQLVAVRGRIFILSGKKISFDEESRQLYDAVAPAFPESHYKKLLVELGELLPGSGKVSDRLERYKQSFVIPKEKLDAVFKAAIAKGRRLTLQHIPLPSTESFTVEYVNNKPWSGYNWYKGGSFSVIQVNTDLPIFIDRAVDLACHEGYPGHHVYNMLMEKNLVRERGWLEFSVYPLFSPQSLIAEGSANFGIEVALPGEERVNFEREVLFPIAGIEPLKASEYYKIQSVKAKLDYAGNESARNYLDGKWSREDAVEWLVTYALFSPERALQRVGFIERYRSYVINYNLGQDMVRTYIEKRGGNTGNAPLRWKLFEELLSQPHTPSDLR
ncbi:MAG: hypothetical protein WBZ48_01535, partial [Bacteroidota bacterium]